MARYEVKLPIVGHAIVLVDAPDEGTAIDKALSEVTTADIEVWEGIRRYHQGNVCYCPRPWEAEATLEDIDEP